jgi:uncharacterized membrane protein
MVNPYFKVWIEVIALTVLTGVMIQDSVPAFVTYFMVSIVGLGLIIYHAKNWDYIKKGNM